MMDEIDSLLDERVVAPAGVQSGEAMVWNGTSWVRSSVTRIGVSSLGSGSPSSSNFLRGDGAWTAVPAPSVVTSAQMTALTPSDGDEVYLEVDSTNGIYWHFRYRSASGSSYKWEFLGGPPLYSAVATSESTTGDSYAALSTAGPSVTLPRDGDYDVTLGFTGYNGTTGYGARMSFDIGGSAAADADSVFAPGGGAANSMSSVQRAVRKTGLTAVTLTSKYRRDGGAGSALFQTRFIFVTPIRVS